MPHFTTYNNRRAIIEVDYNGELLFHKTQERPMSPRYRIVDPVEIVSKLRAARWHVEQPNYRLMTSRRNWTAAFLAVPPWEETYGGYRNGLRCLCDHTGRHAIKIAPGTTRTICANQFTGDVIWRCRHDDIPNITQFLNNPVEVFSALAERRALSDIIEDLRGAPVSEEWLNRLEAHPRIEKAVWRAWREYYGHNYDAWGFLQALTHVKRPTAQRLADDVLAEVMVADRQ